MGKVRVGFIGAGNIAQAHLKNLSNNKDVDIVAICDIDEKTVQQQANHYQANGYTDVDQMLEETALDAVFICVPPFARGKLEEKVVARGIALFVEKPVDLCLNQAIEKEKIIQQAKVIHASGYCLRYLDTVQKAKKYLQDKKIAMVRGHYLSGFVETPWYRVKEKSGGQLVEQATHVLDLMSYLAGDIVKVHADAGLVVMDDIENINIPDVTSVNVVFKSGAVGHLDTTFTQPDHRMGVEFLGRDFRVEIKGTDLVILDQEGKRTDHATVDFLEEQDRKFIQAVKSNDQGEIYASYADGVKTLAASLAANQSYEKGQIVHL